MTKAAKITKSKLHATLSSDGSDIPVRSIYAYHERDAAHAEKRRLHARASAGKDWDGTSANDNIAWPLATALIKEGNTELLKYAMMYRKVHDTAKSEAKLGGSSVSLGDGMALDRNVHIKDNGSIAYKHVRQSVAADKDMPARRKTQTDAEAQHTSEKAESGYTNVPKQWKGDEPVNNMIDAQRRLGSLRQALGHLCEPFELACIDGRTLQEVGNAVGTANRAGAMGAGRAIVHMALITLRDSMGEIHRSDLTTHKV